MKRKNILKSIILVVALILLFTIKVTASDNRTTISEAYIPSEASNEVIILEVIDIERVNPVTLEEADKAIDDTINRNIKAVMVYNGLIDLGYEENHPAVILASTEIDNAKTDYEHYKDIQDKIKKRAEEYPVANQIWEYMKTLGWNDNVCAGIMGNLMAEVGGQTLNIKYDSYSSNGNYYGICQWNKSAYGDVHGTDLETQCNFLKNTIEKEINTYGKLYKKGFDYEDFLKLNSPSEVALCFAKAYERCGSKSYKIRQENAEKAYEYFVD